MRNVRLAMAGGPGAALLIGLLVQQGLAEPVRQPASGSRKAYDYGYSYTDFRQPDQPSESPSDRPLPTAEQQPQPVHDPVYTLRRPYRYGRPPWTLPQPRLLSNRGITLGGWTEVGISVAANMPADLFNGVVTFNDRDGEGQLNQLWFYLDREVDTGGYGWDIGGRIDFVYGTDAMFTQAADGLEANWNQTEPFYQAALPQFCLDVGYNDWTVRMGHFFTIIGYEVVPAPENFFYSHAYAMQHGEPFTHTGMLVTYQFHDRLSATAGFHRGWDAFEDTVGTDSLGFLGGVNWTSWNERLEVAFALTASEELPYDANVTMYSLVATWYVTDNFIYVIQHDYGQGVLSGESKAEWYGLNQYFLYDLSDAWALGLRFEWFRDNDGSRVHGIRPSNTLNTANALGGQFFQGNFYQITLGLNWTPRPNIILRPEVRWDWSNARAQGPGGPIYPYDTGDQGHQFLFGCDLIVTY